MQPDTSNLNRYKIGFLNLEPRITSTKKEQFNQYLRFLNNFDFIDINSRQSELIDGCNLLIVDSTNLAGEAFYTWLHGFAQKMEQSNHVWIPAIILTRIGFREILDHLPKAVFDNWYFDLVTPGEFASLPIRIANLLKIHDHLQELWRYNSTLNNLQQKVDDLEKKLQTLRKS